MMAGGGAGDTTATAPDDTDDDGYGNYSIDDDTTNERTANGTTNLDHGGVDGNGNGVVVADIEKEEHDYIFGFGSIMNRGTHGENFLPGVSVVLSKEFGYERRWNFRSSTGFTALGVSKVSKGKEVNGVLFRVTQSMIPVFDRREVGYEKVRIPLEYLTFVGCDGETSNNVDKNERTDDKGGNNNNNNNNPDEQEPRPPPSWHKILGPEHRLWLYVPLDSHTKTADENHPLLQSYVDTVLQGCLEWGGEAMAESFILTTGGWSTYFLNDTPSGRRPWLYRKDYSTIDRLLQKHVSKTYFGDRKHPEEFSSAFHRRMKGTWSIPRRNSNFTGREKELKHLWRRFAAGTFTMSGQGRHSSSNNLILAAASSKQNLQHQHQQQMVVKVEVAGMGGVGKTQLVTEYCYQHFPTDYGLVVWLNAESAETLVADYRQLLMDLVQENASEIIVAANKTSSSSSSSSAAAAASASTGPKASSLGDGNGTTSTALGQNTDEIVREVKTRLFRSQVPWLLVFDNLEDRDLLDVFVPRGAGRRGHILVTTRHFEMEWGADQSCGSLLLGCFNPCESVELLKRAAGASNTRGEANRDAAREIATKLGHLPLALGMAAAYMLRCDVSSFEYLERYNASEEIGQSLLRHGKLQDYSLSVASSLSMSLVAIEKESGVAHDMLQLLCFLGPEQITKPLLRHLMSSENQLRLLAKRLCDREQQTRGKIFSLGVSALLSCCLAAGLAITAGPRTGGSGACRKAGSSGGNTIATLSAVSALLVTSYSGLAVYDDYYTARERKRVSNSEQAQVRPSPFAFSATVYEDADAVWNILKSFSLLIVKEGKGSMHRLLSQALRQSQTESECRKNSRICLHAMQSIWTFRADEPNTWKESVHVLDHVKSVVSHAGSCGFDFKEDRLKAGRLSIQTGVYSAMALNAFIDAQQSFELAISLFENSEEAQSYIMQTARADALHELGRVFRYQGKYDESEESLKEALKVYEKFVSRDPVAMKRFADTLHELGVLEVKKHNLSSATRFLELSLDMRQRMDHPEENAAPSASTLHQLAAIMVARKPPHLEKAKYLLEEALGLCRQIGQRAATLKQLARVTIRQGLLDLAETYLEQALDLYMELYGENKNHINIAAVKFQQGVLARQREQWEQARLHFSACLIIRRNVYAYARPVAGGGEEEEDKEENPTHLEIACVLQEIARTAFAQSYFSQAVATLQAERVILERLEETSEHNTEKIYQIRMTNLTWLRKCAKAIGDEDLVTLCTNERTSLKQSSGTRRGRQNSISDEAAPFPNNEVGGSDSVHSRSLQDSAMRCRFAARKLVLERDRDGSKLANLNFALSHLLGELKTMPLCPMSAPVTAFRNEVLKWKDRPKGERQAPLLEACDVLRDVLRANGLEVNDSTSSRSKRPPIAS